MNTPALDAVLSVIDEEIHTSLQRVRTKEAVSMAVTSMEVLRKARQELATLKQELDKKSTALAAWSSQR